MLQTGRRERYRHIGGHVDEISRPCLSGVLELVAPAHAGFAFDDVDDTLSVGTASAYTLRTLAAPDVWSNKCIDTLSD